MRRPTKSLIVLSSRGWTKADGSAWAALLQELQDRPSVLVALVPCTSITGAHTAVGDEDASRHVTSVASGPPEAIRGADYKHSKCSGSIGCTWPTLPNDETRPVS